MRSLAYAVLAAISVFFSVPLLAASVEAVKVQQAFERSFLENVKAAGKDFGTCEFTLVQEDGPGHEGPAIGVACTKAPVICVFQARMNADGSDVEVRPLECAPNPAYVDPSDAAPKTSI